MFHGYLVCRTSQTKTVADGIFIVTPNEDLKPGQYMITFSALDNTGYDFGIK
jgi:hypothetical protein